MMGEKWWTRSWVQNAGLILAAAIGVYALIYRDVVSRAKESYLEAEKYMEWSSHPEKKQDYYTQVFEKKKSSLDQSLQKKEVTEADYKKKLESLEFDRNFALEESSLKYAYQWYKDTYELFSPPDSKWVKLAREKAPQALAQWKQELDAKKIPYKGYMFE